MTTASPPFFGSNVVIVITNLQGLTGTALSLYSESKHAPFLNIGHIAERQWPFRHKAPLRSEPSGEHNSNCVMSDSPLILLAVVCIHIDFNHI